MRFVFLTFFLRLSGLVGRSSQPDIRFFFCLLFVVIIISVIIIISVVVLLLLVVFLVLLFFISNSFSRLSGTLFFFDDGLGLAHKWIFENDEDNPVFDVFGELPWKVLSLSLFPSFFSHVLLFL